MAAMRQAAFMNARLMRHWCGVQPRLTRRSTTSAGKVPEPAERQMKVLHIMSQIMLTALFALSISFLTFAASFAEAPRSEFLPASAVQTR